MATKIPKAKAAQFSGPAISVSNSSFTVNAKMDGQSATIVQTIASAILNMTELLKNNQINVDCLLKIDNSSSEIQTT